MAFNLSSCPSGWITADGTNGTPDLRGEFIRGLDSGRGVDSGRTLGSSQGQGVQSLASDNWVSMIFDSPNASMNTVSVNPVS